jgi:hypothetical protein
MYDFYPEWGPARHRETPEAEPAERRPRYWAAATTVARDSESEQPDDN